MDSYGWLILGFVAQILFFFRFAVQWVASERAGRSIIPVSFWYLSILGSIGLLAYSIHKVDPVFIAGQTFGVFVYARNLVLIKRQSAGGNAEQ